MQTLNDDAYHAYHQDEQGSTAYITGGNGAVENSYAYDVFGNELESRESIENRIRYTGQQYDQETGQYYLRARFYNPVIGRFTQEDTYRGDGLNLYAYCGNNPVMYYDPSGHGQEKYGTQPTTEPEKPKSAEESGVPSGYYQDANGRWHRPNNQFASNAEVGLPSDSTNTGSGRGGRLGNESTRAQNRAIGDYLKEHGYTITGGGGRLSEEYLPGAEGGVRGSNYVDVTAVKGNETIRINTVDVYANGTPTIRELNAANSINQKTGGNIILIPKGEGIGNLLQSLEID